jgi:hypothetical protein
MTATTGGFRVNRCVLPGASDVDTIPDDGAGGGGAGADHRNDLIADDDADVRHMIRTLLGLDGYEACEARDARHRP